GGPERRDRRQGRQQPDPGLQAPRAGPGRGPRAAGRVGLPRGQGASADRGRACIGPSGSTLGHDRLDRHPRRDGHPQRLRRALWHTGRPADPDRPAGGLRRLARVAQADGVRQADPAFHGRRRRRPGRKALMLTTGTQLAVLAGGLIAGGLVLVVMWLVPARPDALDVARRYSPEAITARASAPVPVNSTDRAGIWAIRRLPTAWWGTTPTKELSLLQIPLHRHLGKKVTAALTGLILPPTVTLAAAMLG